MDSWSISVVIVAVLTVVGIMVGRRIDEIDRGERDERVVFDVLRTVETDIDIAIVDAVLSDVSLLMNALNAERETEIFMPTKWPECVVGPAERWVLPWREVQE